MEAGLNDRYYDFPTNLGFMHPSEPLSSVAMKGLQWLWLRVFLVGDRTVLHMFHSVLTC